MELRPLPALENTQAFGNNKQRREQDAPKPKTKKKQQDSITNPKTNVLFSDMMRAAITEQAHMSLETHTKIAKAFFVNASRVYEDTKKVVSYKNNTKGKTKNILV